MSFGTEEDWKSEEWGELGPGVAAQIYATVYLVCSIPLESPGRDDVEHNPREGWATFYLGMHDKRWFFRGKHIARIEEIIKERYEGLCEYEIEEVFFHKGILD